MKGDEMGGEVRREEVEMRWEVRGRGGEIER